MVKTLDAFRWDWPKAINRLQVEDLFSLRFIRERANVIFLGLVGLGKTHLASALGHAACLRGHRVLFANAIDVINTLHAAQTRGSLKAELRKYTAPEIPATRPTARAIAAGRSIVPSRNAARPPRPPARSAGWRARITTAISTVPTTASG